jgi:P27 family predicted phage terminase small subunit
MTRKQTPKPPSHLRQTTKTWWKSVVSEYELEQHHLKLLRLAAEAWDRGQQAREQIRKHGMTYNDRFGAPKPRPEIAIERDSRIAFARLLRELALDVDAPAEEYSRGPQLPANSSLKLMEG